jgi:hypothetical protein
MATFALVHGSGDGGWVWHLVHRALRDRGHEVVAPDLPTDHDDATWDDCVDVFVEAVGGAGDVVVVGTVRRWPRRAARGRPAGAMLQVYVAGMVPWPGESAAEWFADVGWYRVGGRAGPAGRRPHRQLRPRSPSTTTSRASGQRGHGAGAADRRAAGRDAVAPADVARGSREVRRDDPGPLPPAARSSVASPPNRLGLVEPDEIEAGHCAPLSRPHGAGRHPRGLRRRSGPR